MRGKRKAKFRKKLSQMRKRMIRRKRPYKRNAHPVKLDKRAALQRWMAWWKKKSAGFKRKFTAQMSALKRRKDGRQALRKYTQFTGLPYPTEIKVVQMPGPKKRSRVLVGMGRSPYAFIADGPQGKSSGTKQLKGRFTPTATPDGKQIILLAGRNSTDGTGKKRFAGFAPETHYIPTSEMERAGTHKRGKHWVHLHGKEENGRWPKVFIDSAGNMHYGKSTYRMSDWLYR